MSIILAFIIFFIVVLFHEGGHFFAAKSVGIRVNEFSIGMGPAIWKKTKGETLYSLRALPLGGYCAMEGEDEESASPDSFDAAKPWQRFLTILAGPVMNLLIALLCFILYLGMVGEAVPVIGTFTDHSAFQTAGASVGDRVISVNDTAVSNLEELSAVLQQSGGKTVSVALEGKDGTHKTVETTPMQEEGIYILGFQPHRERSLLHAVPAGFTMLWKTFISLFVVLGKLFTGGLSLGAVSGPIGVVKTIGEAAKQGVAPLIFFAGYISVNLAFFNLLPIPALDGSKLLFIIIEKLRGKPMNKTWETRITMAGFALLMGLILLVSVKDVLQLF